MSMRTLTKWNKKSFQRGIQTTISSIYYKTERLRKTSIDDTKKLLEAINQLELETSFLQEQIRFYETKNQRRKE